MGGPAGKHNRLFSDLLPLALSLQFQSAIPGSSGIRGNSCADNFRVPPSCVYKANATTWSRGTSRLGGSISHQRPTASESRLGSLAQTAVGRPYRFAGRRGSCSTEIRDHPPPRSATTTPGKLLPTIGTKPVSFRSPINNHDHHDRFFCIGQPLLIRLPDHTVTLEL